MRTLLTALVVRQRWSRACPADPFDALEVQVSLARLEREIERLRGYGGRDERPEDPGRVVERVLAVTAPDARGWRW